MTSRTRCICLLSLIGLSIAARSNGHHLVGTVYHSPLNTALEWGAAAVEVRTAPDSMMAVLHEDSFHVFPLREDYRCTPERASPAHALRKRRSVRAQRTIGHVADEQRPILGDLGSCSARFRSEFVQDQNT